jgi:penicillin-binding protein 2
MALNKPRRRVLKNAAAEADQFRGRSAIAFAFVVLALAGLSFWYFRLQVVQHADYATRSEANRIKLRPVVPGRGLIYDRKGRILADNVPAFRLDVTAQEAGDPDKWLPSLSRIVALSEDDLKLRQTRRATRGFGARSRVTEEDYTLAVDRWRYPGRAGVVPTGVTSTASTARDRLRRPHRRQDAECWARPAPR